MTPEELRQVLADNHDQLTELIDAEVAFRAELRIIRQQGRNDGMATLVLQMISDRFGAPSRQVEERVKGGTHGQFRVWAARIPTARTLEDAFDGPAGKDKP